LLGGDLRARVPNQSPPSLAAWDETLTHEAWHFIDDPNAETRSVAISPDGQLLLAGQKGRVALVDMASSRTVALLSCPGGALWKVAFSPDGKLAAAGGEDFTLCLWKLANRQLLGVSKRNEGEGVHKIAFSRNGRQMAVAARPVIVYPVPQ
jgi:WD40 repeat protein